MGFLPNTTYSSSLMGQFAQPHPSAQRSLPASKTPAYSLGPAAGSTANLNHSKPSAAGPGMALIQTGGDGEEKAVPLTDLLVDPITRKKYDLDTPFTDRLLNLTPAQEIKLSFQHAFVTLPKTIMQGLKGDSRFTFSDFLDVANIPYFAGGAFLALSFRAGGDRVNFLRQGLGVGMYFLGIMGANKLINRFYKSISGVDLEQKYRKPNGDIEKVFASVDFPRMDLLPEAMYNYLARKMGIPTNVADPKREVNDQVRQIISAARADKIILGNIAAMAGAAYFARSDMWARLLDNNKPLKAIWQRNDPQQGDFMNRLIKTNSFIWGKTEPAIKDTLHGAANETNPWLRRSLLGTIAASTGLILWHSWNTMNRGQRTYESPFLSNLPPQFAPELSQQTADIQRNLPGGPVQRLNRQSIFETVRNVEARSQQAAANSQGEQS